MNTVVETINAGGRAFVEFALPMLIQSCVLILILVAVDAILRRRVRAVFRYWIWMLVLVKLVLPPWLGSPVSVGTWFGDTLEAPAVSLLSPEPPQAVAPNPPELSPTISAILTPPDPRIAEPILLPPEAPVERARPAVAPTPAATVETSTPAATPAVSLSWQGLVLLVWAAVASALTLLLIQRAYFVRGLVRQTEEADRAMLDELENCRRRLGLRRRVALRLSPNAASPAVCGLFRPTILVPHTLAPRLRSHDLDAVLLHELAHVKRHDLWINLVQTLLQIVYFYNPLLWLANAMIRRTREQAVDEVVLVAMGETAKQYPETLVNIAKLAFTRRPALSLRLIGVVESKSALTARIKHILARPLPKTAKLGLFSLAIVVITAAVLLPMARAAGGSARVANKGPLDIRLVGVCPDGGEELYDADGRRLTGSADLLGVSSSGPWPSNIQYRDFVLQAPDLDGQLLFVPIVRVHPAGKNQTVGSGSVHFDCVEHPSSLIVSATIGRKYTRRWGPPILPEAAVDRVDLPLQYFYGSRREAVCTFTGPFTVDKTMPADDGRPYRLTPESMASWDGSRIRFRFATSQAFDLNVPVLLYDKQGYRYLADSHNGRSGSQGADMTCEAGAVSWDQIAAITIGEKPYEITFENVAVRYPDRPARTHAAYLDTIAQRLGLTSLSPEQIRQYQIANPQEAIHVLDVVRSDWHIRTVFDALNFARTPVRVPDLDEATRQMIHRVAARWAGSDWVSQYGIQLGLMGQWPEFFDMAMDRLGRDYSAGQCGPSGEQMWLRGTRDMAHTLARHWNELNASQVERLKGLISNVHDGVVLHSLFMCLWKAESQAVIDAFWQLAQDDRPWIWWDAIDAWRTKTARRPIRYDDLPEKIQIRLRLVEGTASEAETSAMLPQIFTPEQGKMNSQVWNTVREKIMRGLDRTTATQIYLDYLRQMQSAITPQQWIVDYTYRQNANWMVAYVIRTLNVWYGVNIGHLGTEETARSDLTAPKTLAEFRDLIAEALAWHEANIDAEPDLTRGGGDAAAMSLDSDGDGLSDYEETHKYLTDSAKAWIEDSPARAILRARMPLPTLSTHRYYKQGEPISLYVTGRNSVGWKPRFEEISRGADVNPCVFLIDGREYASRCRIGPVDGGYGAPLDVLDCLYVDRGEVGLSPGRHTVAYGWKDLDIVDPNDPSRPVHFPRLFTDPVEFEVVEELPQDYYRPVYQEGWEEVLRGSIETLFTDDWHEAAAGALLALKVATDNLPFDTAFAVYVQAEGSDEQQRVGDLALQAGRQNFRMGCSSKVKGLDWDTVGDRRWRIILKPSVEVAKKRSPIREFYAREFVTDWASFKRSPRFELHRRMFEKRENDPRQTDADKIQSSSLDSDGDGLSDYEEIHKYLTDPAKADSDGDGTPDGDWNERREYAYSVRTVLRHMPPFDEDGLSDDFQDGRVLAKNDEYVEVEVIHYPLATGYDSVSEDRDWRQDYVGMTAFLAPGVTTNWDDAMRRDLLAALKADGIDVETLSDKQVVEQVSSWLMKRSRYLDKAFTTYYVDYPQGTPRVLPGLEDAFRREFERDSANYDWTIEQHFDHELLGKGMFYNKTHGSCTSTAVYLTTVLRAIGIPTRMVLVAPAVDASDREQILMAKRALTHNRVRETVLAGLRRSNHGFTNHTLNEVYVGGRWRRLDYTRLGCPAFGVDRFGLQTHLYTINDLSDVNFAPTWGRRYAKGERSDVFAHDNPYSAVEVSELFGAHANIANPPFAPPDVSSSGKPDVFLFSPNNVRIWDDFIARVKDRTWNKTGRPHAKEHYDDLFEGVWTSKPGDLVVLLFSLDTPERIPQEYEDILPKSWSEIELELKQGQTVELAGKAREMNVILLATPAAAELKPLVQNSELLASPGNTAVSKTLKPSLKTTSSSSALGVGLPTGVKVELLGVCEYPSEGRQWWKLDGSLMDSAPYKTTGSKREPEAGSKDYELVVRYGGASDVDIIWDVPGSSNTSTTGNPYGQDDRPISGLSVDTVRFPDSRTEIDVRIAAAAGPWETRAVHRTLDREGVYDLGDGKAVTFGIAHAQGDSIFVPVTANFFRRDIAFRVVAVQREGEVLSGGFSGVGDGKLNSLTYRFSCPLSDVKEFHFETRSWTWFEFKNVSLWPGHKTDIASEASFPGPNAPVRVRPSGHEKVLGIGPAWEALRDTLGKRYGGSIGGFGRDEARSTEYLDKVLSWTRPGDVLVLMLAFDKEPVVPEQYRDLLPLPWSAIESRVHNGESVEASGKARGLDVIVLATATSEQLETLVRQTHLLDAYRVDSGAASAESKDKSPFSVHGVVTDASGRPMAGVDVRAHCGLMTLMLTGHTMTDENGRYTLYFKPGVLSSEVLPQAASICARKDGFYEANLCCQGNLAMAGKPSKPEAVARYAGVVLPDKPYELNFVMLPAARIEGRLVDTAGKPLPGRDLWLVGKELYPATNVLASLKTDPNGGFVIEQVPLKSYWFQAGSQKNVRSDGIEFTTPGTWQVTLQYRESSAGNPQLAIVTLRRPENRRVYLPDLEKPNADTILDLATGEFLPGEPMGRDPEYLDKLGKGDIAYEWASGKSGLLCFRGTRVIEVSTQQSDGRQTTEAVRPDVRRPGFFVYFIDAPCRYVLATANGERYRLNVISIDKGDSGGALVEIAKVDGSSTTGSFGGVLEFRIAARLGTLDSTTAERYQMALVNDDNPPGADYAWFPLRASATCSPETLVDEQGGIAYVLLWNKPPHAILASQDWGLESVYKVQDASRRPAIGLTFNEKGASLFHEITAANVYQAMAILVDGKVLSMPQIQAPLGKAAIISGNFSEQEVQDLIAILRKGIGRQPANDTSVGVAPTESAGSSQQRTAPTKPAGVNGTLPNGATVTLLGLFTQQDTDHLQWWYPDGTPAPAEQFAEFHRGFVLPPSPYFQYGYLIQFDSVSDMRVQTVVGAGVENACGALAGHSSVGVGLVTSHGIPQESDLPAVGDIRVVLATGAYKTVEKSYEYGAINDILTLEEGHRLAIYTPWERPHPDSIVTAVANTDNLDIRLRYALANNEIQIKGPEVPQKCQTGPLTSTDFCFMPDENGSITRIFVDYRPADVVHFRNVSLRSGHKADVRVEVRPAQVAKSKPPISNGRGPLGRQALSFDGIDDYLIVPAGPSLAIRSPFTVEMWFKPDPAVAQHPPMTLMQQGHKPDDPRDFQAGGFLMTGSRSDRSGMPGAGSLFVGGKEGRLAGKDMAMSPPLEQAGWVYLCTRCRGGDYAPAEDEPLRIGSDFVPKDVKTENSPRPFKGQIAEIRIWNKALTEAEAQWYRSTSLLGNEPNLVACWTFDEGSGQVVHDITPNANHARLGNSVTADDADPHWTSLEAGQTFATTSVSREAVKHNMMQLGLGAVLYANEHHGDLPTTLAPLESYVGDAQAFTWLKDNAVYVAQGNVKAPPTPHSRVVAYEAAQKTSSATSDRYILFLDGHVELVGSQRREELNRKSVNQSLAEAQALSQIGAAERPNRPVADGGPSGRPQDTLKRLLDEAQPGNTVVIPKGRYTMPIDITKPLVLRGESREDCVIEVVADRSAILVNAGGRGDVTIENLTIRWQLASRDRVERPFALGVKDTNVTIRNCRFVALDEPQLTPIAVQIEGRSKATVENCRSNGFDYAICYGQGTEGVVQDCIIADCGHQGVIAYDGATLTVQRNVIAGSKFHAVRCTGGTLYVKDNLLIGNANRGIYLGNRTGRGTITNNAIVGNGAGISGFGQADYVIANNVIVDNEYAGINMQDSCRLSIRKNVLAKNRRGIALFKESAENSNTISENAYWGNAADFENLEKPEGSLTADPQFVDPNHGDFTMHGPVRVRSQGCGLTDPPVIKRLWDAYSQLPQNERIEPTAQKGVSSSAEPAKAKEPAPVESAAASGPGPIQQRIDEAAPGATIRLEPGVYNERLTIDKPLTLEGAGWDKTSIVVEIRATELSEQIEKAAKSSPGELEPLRKRYMEEVARPVLAITNARDVTIRGIKFSAPGRRVQGRSLPTAIVTLSHGVAQLSDCAIVGGAGDGIRVNDESGATLQRCLVAAVWGTGIIVGSGKDASELRIEDSDVRNCHYTGIRVAKDSRAAIERCRVSGAAWHGIRYDDASPLISNSLIFGNARSGIYASGQTGAMVKGNLFYANAMGGMSCWFQDKDTIEDNTFADNKGPALAILGASKPSVRNNIFYAGPAGITIGDVRDNSPFAKSEGGASFENNVFWASEQPIQRMTDDGAVQAVALEEKMGIALDPGFTTPEAKDFSLKADSPARQKGVGAADLIPFESPWELQPEEKAIIPQGDTRDYRQWRDPPVP